MHAVFMSRPQQAIRIPASAVVEFEEVEAMDWSDGLSLSELLRWVNEVAARFRPPDIGEDSRASGEFSPRSFRHYQTLGCIDSPERAGKQVRYRFRHYVQALLLRKLLWERVPSERITTLMAGRSTAETRQLLFEGIEIVARQGGAEEVERWKRIRVTPGVELHLRGDLPKPRPAELKKLLAHLETALRKNL
jgi:DNA-binding transcriptional MerR regulator